MILVLLGPPGAGKGTQGRRLESEFGLRLISTGDLLRAAIEADTELGRLAQEPIARGELVPDDLIIRMIDEELARLPANGAVLDGFPRTLAQAEALAGILERQDKKLTHVIELRVDVEALVRRLSGRFQCADCGSVYHDEFNPPSQPGICDNCGSTSFNRREDDSAETIRARLAHYTRQTVPLLQYYSGRGLLRSVDAMAEIDSVTAAINSILNGA